MSFFNPYDPTGGQQNPFLQQMMSQMQVPNATPNLSISQGGKNSVMMPQQPQQPQKPQQPGQAGGAVGSAVQSGENVAKLYDMGKNLSHFVGKQYDNLFGDTPTTTDPNTFSSTLNNNMNAMKADSMGGTDATNVFGGQGMSGPQMFGSMGPNGLSGMNFTGMPPIGGDMGAGAAAAGSDAAASGGADAAATDGAMDFSSSNASWLQQLWEAL